jgi:hypothetical protein
MNSQTSKALTILGGVATLALGSTFMLRLSAPKPKPQLGNCAPRMLELERSVCEPVAQRRAGADATLAFSTARTEQ